MKVKELMGLFHHNGSNTLFIRAVTASATSDAIWEGTFDEFRKENPAIGYECDACGEKISDQTVDDAILDDSEEDSLTITLKGDHRYLDRDE